MHLGLENPSQNTEGNDQLSAGNEKLNLVVLLDMQPLHTPTATEAEHKLINFILPDSAEGMRSQIDSLKVALAQKDRETEQSKQRRDTARAEADRSLGDAQRLKGQRDYTDSQLKSAERNCKQKENPPHHDGRSYPVSWDRSDPPGLVVGSDFGRLSDTPEQMKQQIGILEKLILQKAQEQQRYDRQSQEALGVWRQAQSDVSAYNSDIQQLSSALSRSSQNCR